MNGGGPLLQTGQAHQSPAYAADPALSRRVRSAPWADHTWDVVVVGSGNAALVAALAAEERGASVLVLERAPHHQRGGNSRHTRNIRCVHEATPYTSGRYTFDEMWRDLCDVGEGPNDE
jgi:tricarballylate dehydrogenase